MSDWHAKAREMRARGKTLGQIAQRFGVHHTSVLSAVDPTRRAYEKRRARERWAAGPQKHRRRARSGWALLAEAMAEL